MSGTSVRRVVDAIAFDVDGTIADTDPVHGAAWARALQTVTGRTFTVERYLAACIAGVMSPLDFISKYVSHEDLAPVEREKRRIYPDMLRSCDVKSTPGLLSLLDQAREASVRTAVVSSSSRESVEAILARLWSVPGPAVVIARGDSSAAKPDPAPYVSALEQLELPAARVAAFEDSASGITSATAAGLFCVQVGVETQNGAPRIVDFTDCTIESAGDTASLTVRVR